MCIRSHFLFILQAQFDAGELITQRETVSHRVSEELTERAKQFGLILDDISLVSKQLETYIYLSLNESSRDREGNHFSRVRNL